MLVSSPLGKPGKPVQITIFPVGKLVDMVNTVPTKSSSSPLLFLKNRLSIHEKLGYPSFSWILVFLCLFSHTCPALLQLQILESCREPLTVPLWTSMVPAVSSNSPNSSSDLDTSLLSTPDEFCDLLSEYPDVVSSKCFFASDPKHSICHTFPTLPGPLVLAALMQRSWNQQERSLQL